MFERGIDVSEVLQTLETGETIGRYDDDRPYPSRLMLGWSAGEPLHVVAADTPKGEITIVITAYRPDADLWTADFRSRK